MTSTPSRSQAAHLHQAQRLTGMNRVVGLAISMAIYQWAFPHGQTWPILIGALLIVGSFPRACGEAFELMRRKAGEP